MPPGLALPPGVALPLPPGLALPFPDAGLSDAGLVVDVAECVLNVVVVAAFGSASAG